VADTATLFSLALPYAAAPSGSIAFSVRRRDRSNDPVVDADPVLAQQAQWTIGVSNLWQDLSARLEPVTLISRSEPDVLPLEEVLPE